MRWTSDRRQAGEWTHDRTTRRRSSPKTSPACSSSAPTPRTRRARRALRGGRRHGVPARPADRGPGGDPKLWEKALPHLPAFEPEPPLPTLISGDLALTSTPPKDGAGARAQVVRRQPDGTWLRVLDQPEFVTPAS